MLHRIAQREEAAARALESVAQGDQFLPTVHADPPAVTQIARELLSVDIQIGHVGIAPDERMERLDVDARRAIFFSAINLYGSRFAQLDRDDPFSGIGPEKQRVFFKRHGARDSSTSLGMTTDDIFAAGVPSRAISKEGAAFI